MAEDFAQNVAGVAKLTSGTTSNRILVKSLIYIAGTEVISKPSVGNTK